MVHPLPHLPPLHVWLFPQSVPLAFVVQLVVLDNGVQTSHWFVEFDAPDARKLPLMKQPLEHVLPLHTMPLPHMVPVCFVDQVVVLVPGEHTWHGVAGLLLPDP